MASTKMQMLCRRRFSISSTVAPGSPSTTKRRSRSRTAPRKNFVQQQVFLGFVAYHNTSVGVPICVNVLSKNTSVREYESLSDGSSKNSVFAASGEQHGTNRKRKKDMA